MKALIFLVLIALASLSHAGDLDKYCSLMYSIYGCCSPELVQNYLVMTAPHPPRVIPAKVVMVNETPAIMQEKLMALLEVIEQPKFKFGQFYLGRGYYGGGGTFWQLYPKGWTIGDGVYLKQKPF